MPSLSILQKFNKVFWYSINQRAPFQRCCSREWISSLSLGKFFPFSYIMLRLASEICKFISNLFCVLEYNDRLSLPCQWHSLSSPPYGQNSSNIWYHACSSSLLHIELMSLWISCHNVSPFAWINSAGIWSLPGDLYFFNFAATISTSKG
jgi:hypothetical protein